MRSARRLPIIVAWVLACLPALPLAGQTMPDPREMSGIPLPSRDLPAGTVAVRVIRGGFANNVTDAPVEFTTSGRTTTVRTDSSGRAQTSGWATGARVVVRTTVDGEQLESQEIIIGESGVRLILVATGAASTVAVPAPEAPARPGRLALGPRSRLVVDFVDDRLRVFYVMDVVNPSSEPVNPGGPLVFELPRTARGVTMLDGTTKQATANGPRVTVTGPFAPGSTTVSFGFELPHSGPTARLEQIWPVDLARLSVFALKTGELDIQSSQLTRKALTHQQGQPLVEGEVPPIAAGQSLVLDVTGLPYHPRWPRYMALTAAALLVSWGLWAAFVPERRRSA